MFNLTVIRRAVQMTFVKEDENWYVDFPEYPGAKANLQMVLGADKLLDDILIQQNGSDKVTIEISTKPFPVVERYKLVLADPEDLPECYDIEYGRWYMVNYHAGQEHMDLIWLCPVMVYTFGHYPETIFINI